MSDSQAHNPHGDNDLSADALRGHAVTVDLRSLLIRVVGFFLAMDILLFLADWVIIGGDYFRWTSIRWVFYLEFEDSLGSWYASLQTLLSGISLAAIFALSRRGSDARTVGWGLLAAFFVFMAFDDATLIHERLGTTFQVHAEHYTNSEPDTLLPSYAWQFFVGPFFISIGLYMAWFLWRELSEGGSRYLMFVGFGLLASAMSLDFIEGMNLPGQTGEAAKNMFWRVEETLELLGNTVFLYIFLRELFTRVSALDRVFTFRFDPGK